MSAQYSVVFTAAALRSSTISAIPAVTIWRRSGIRASPRWRKRSNWSRDPKFQALYPRKMPTRVEIETVTGEKHQAEIFGAKGHFENPMSASEIEAKFRKLTSGILPAGQIDRVFEAISV